MHPNTLLGLFTRHGPCYDGFAAAGEFPCSNSGYIFSAHETEYFWG